MGLTSRLCAHLQISSINALSRRSATVDSHEFNMHIPDGFKMIPCFLCEPTGPTILECQGLLIDPAHHVVREFAHWLICSRYGLVRHYDQMRSENSCSKRTIPSFKRHSRASNRLRAGNGLSGITLRSRLASIPRLNSSRT
jgi:hypothetical protein